jgi:hypothetical protein
MNHHFLILILLFFYNLDSYSEIQKRVSKSEDQQFNLLILGGGYSASGNEVSLESNVRYLLRQKDGIGLSKFRTKTLFSDGLDAARDIKYRDPSFTVPETNLILAEIFGSTRGIYNQYRNNQLKADGASSIKGFDKWLKDVNSSSKRTSNLIYFTGHGGKGEKKTPYNTTAYLWNNYKFRVSEFTKKLDSLPSEQTFILVMVQCYSGGFANYIFREGDSKKGLHPQVRAGFFATVHDRVAAGCTPDIREENYQEYSTHFWEALCGESRIGKKIQKPDFNGDGSTSLTEAHAYVVIHSNTIDIPIKTSDVFLRKFSSFDPPQEEDALGKIIKNAKDLLSGTDSNISDREVPPKDWVFRKDPISKILLSASPESKVIIQTLAKRLTIQGEKLFEKAENKIKEIKKRREELAKAKKEKDDQKKKLKDKIKTRLVKEWPELANIHHPSVDSLKQSKDSFKLITLSNQDNEWSDYKMRREESAQIENERFKLEKTQVLAMRLTYEIENVVLRVALPKINSQDIIERYTLIEELEKTIFRQPKGLPRKRL